MRRSGRVNAYEALDAESDQIFHPLDGWVDVERPTQWSREIVFSRLVEACIVISHETAGRPRMGNGWPEIVRDWADLIGRGTEARADVWASWERSRPAYDAETISRAEEAAHWAIRYLHDHDGAARVLMAWATTSAYGRPFAPVVKRKRWAISTVKRRRHQALDLIVAALSTARIPIREAVISPRP